MSSEREARTSALLEESFPSPPESLLEHSFLNPILADGARGGVGVARRRIGVLVTALLGGEEMHPVMNSENIRATLREELSELDSILEAVEWEMERQEKRGQHPTEAGQS